MISTQAGRKSDMTKILLIKPTAGNTPHRQVSHPLGLMYLASALRQAGDYDVRIVDMRLLSRAMEQTVLVLRQMEPDIVGISAFTLEAPTVHALTRTVKGMVHPAKVVMGGPYPTSDPQGALADPNIDLVVLGEGELTFPQVVSHLESGCSDTLEAIPGIAFRHDGKVLTTRAREEIADTNTLPFPAWDLVDISAYAKAERFSNVRKNRYMSLFTSRSCPYQCIYCHKIFGKGFRPRSPENVVAEMEFLVNTHGVREIEIVDDIFNLDAQRAEMICDLIVRRGLDIKIAFPNGMRGDLLTGRLLRKLKKAGVHFTGIAVETGSPRLQKVIRKNLDLKKVNQAITMAVDLGITTVGYFMLGFPTETREEIMATVDFACQSRLNFASFFTVTPFEGTGLHDLCLPRLKELGGEKDLDFHRNTFNLSEVPDKEFFRIKRQAYRRFYSRAFSRIIVPRAYRDLSLLQALRLSSQRVL